MCGPPGSSRGGYSHGVWTDGVSNSAMAVAEDAKQATLKTEKYRAKLEGCLGGRQSTGGHAKRRMAWHGRPESPSNSLNLEEDVHTQACSGSR